MADFEIIAEGTLSTGASSITLTSIPQTYTHLEFQISARGSYASAYPGSSQMRFNSDSGSNYGGHDGYVSSGTGGAEGYSLNALTQTYYSNALALDSWTANIQGFSSWIIPNYTSTSFAKQVYRTASVTDASSIYTLRFGSSAWDNTAAITQIELLEPSAGTEFMAQSSYWLAGWA
ncbi:MAG: hypothetical protein CMG34_07275 [Candidatus Marinimicrobia bacterium]|nr:hypothetical protein [Candidatus Neomarinimicrobiota bacterium]|tara:strand:- start:4467 stop:4994 length:528 start_codon:yes stop_codon:yes gene_type:complete